MPADRYDYQIEIPRTTIARASSYASEYPVHSEIFDFLSPYIPTAGDSIVLGGSWSSSLASPFRADRVDAETISVTVARQGYKRAGATFFVREGSIDTMGAVHLVV